MDERRAKLTLLGVEDDESLLDDEYQALEQANRDVYEDEFEYCSGRLRIYGLTAAPIVEFLIPLAQVVGPTAGTVLVAWLTGRAGRRVRFKMKDIEIEARTAEEVNALLEKAMDMQFRREGSAEK